MDHEEVDKIFGNTLDDLEKVNVFSNKGIPPTIAQAGYAFTYPSHNAFAGRQKTERNYACGHYHQQGHNKQN